MCGLHGVSPPQKLILSMEKHDLFEDYVIMYLFLEHGDFPLSMLVFWRVVGSHVHHH